MEYIVNQYSVIEDCIMWQCWYEVFRPDGSSLVRIYNTHADDSENKKDAHKVADELNSLLVLPKPPIVMRDIMTPEQHAIADAKTLNSVLSVLVPSKGEINEATNND